ncbi:MAG: hypothetical protein M1820_007363 [Bogoriella megaspora]|nr:MAG: hypothetical protein M1820_007363 [Bogoriella megaspora]
MELIRRSFGLSTGGAKEQAIFAVFSFVLAGLLVAGRFVARKMKAATPSLDDWLMLAAFVMIFLGGAGYHAQDLSEEDIMTVAKLLTVIQFPYGIAMTSIRLSICILLVRVFVMRWFRTSVWVVMTLNIMWGLYVVIAALAICTPLAFNWDKSIPGGHCGNTRAGYIFMAVFAIVLDAAIFTLPIPAVWTLQLSKPKKLGLIAIFSLGLMDIIISIFRIVNLLRVDFQDLPFTLTGVNIWSIVEPAIGILVGCAPVLRPVISYLFPSFMLTSKNKSSKGISSHTAEHAKPQDYGQLNDDQIELVQKGDRIYMGREFTVKTEEYAHA